ncbi:MAG: hypothetical protein AAF585_17800, partial [Verrucomicrobiota bacterium]
VTQHIIEVGDEADWKFDHGIEMNGARGALMVWVSMVDQSGKGKEFEISLQRITGLLAEVRTWTAAQGGRTFEGELKEVKDDQVVIVRSDGQAFTLPISRLSEADQKFIADSQKPERAPTEPGATPAAADMKIPEGPTELVLTEAHACCRGCYEAIEGSLGSLSGVEVEASENTITIKGESGGLVEAALGYVMHRGFYGKPSIPAFADKKKYNATKVEKLFLSRIHICCRDCEKAMEETLEGVNGIDEIGEIEKGVSEIEITGMISQADVIAALHASGMHATVSPNSRK